MRRTLLTGLVVVAAAAPALAQVEREPSDVGEDHAQHDTRWRYPIILLETAGILVPPAIYYWNTVQDQKEDWELRWDWPSWEGKLFSTQNLVLDTNRFMPNAVRHPLAGALSYQVGRANGLSPLASTVLDFASSLFWEYVVEYREDPSVNDMFCNTIGGIFIGEPLFQLGKLGDDHASGWRRALAWVESPFDRAQRALGLSWRPEEPTPANELAVRLAPSVARFSAQSHRPELAFGLDLSLVRDPAFGEPGDGTTTSGLAGWDRELLDLRFGSAPDSSGVTGARYRSELTYGARYVRSLDEDGHGDAGMVSVAGGFDLSERKLPDTWDRLGVFELVGPKLELFHTTSTIAVDAELAAYADVAMVEAHVFPDPPETARSVLLDRGYYYATGATGVARVRVRGAWWGAELDATADQFWSFDDHRQGGDMDPKGVQDQRVISTARVGVRPGRGAWTVELFGDAVVRRGTWQRMARADTELDAGLGLSAGF